MVHDCEHNQSIVSWKKWSKCAAEIPVKNVETGVDGEKTTFTSTIIKEKNDFVKVNGTIQKLVEELVEDLHAMPKHMYIASHQQQQTWQQTWQKPV